MSAALFSIFLSPNSPIQPGLTAQVIIVIIGDLPHAYIKRLRYPVNFDRFLEIREVGESGVIWPVV